MNQGHFSVSTMYSLVRGGQLEETYPGNPETGSWRITVQRKTWYRFSPPA